MKANNQIDTVGCLDAMYRWIIDSRRWWCNIETLEWIVTSYLYRWKIEWMLGRIWYHFDGVTDRIGKDWKTCLWALRIMTEVCWMFGDDSVSIITGLAAWSGRRPSYRWRVLVSRRGVGDDPHIGGVRVWTVCCTSGVQVGLLRWLLSMFLSSESRLTYWDFW